MISRGCADPRTLIRAAKDYAVKKPDFAIAVGMEGLRLIAAGHGYDITSSNVRDAYPALMQSANTAGIDTTQIQMQIHGMLSVAKPPK